MSKKHIEIKAEDIENILKEMYGDKFDLTYEELRKRILPNYSYSINHKKQFENERNTKIHTGMGGVLLIIKECEEIGLPAFMIAEDILVHTNIGNIKLIDLKVKSKND